MHGKTSNRTQHTGGHPRLAADQAAPRLTASPPAARPGAARAAPFAAQWPYRSFLELGGHRGAGGAAVAGRPWASALPEAYLELLEVVVQDAGRPVRAVQIAAAAGPESAYDPAVPP